MPSYRVRLAGAGFQKTVDGVSGTYGFYANCFVKSATPEEAEAKAVEAICKRDDVRQQLASSAHATVVVDETAELNDVVMPSPQGLVWFPQE